MTNPPPIFAKVDAELVPIEDCTWILNRPCGCACQAFASNSNLASQEAAWRVIYANDKRASRRIEYALREGFDLRLIKTASLAAEIYPVWEACVHGLHVPGLQRIVLPGARHDRLTVIERREPGQHSIKCRCECGTELVLPFSQWGTTRSCGCLRREMLIRRSTKHGRTGTSEYDIWSAMVQRTTNPNNARYADYGGRGITVCERWMSFENFFADMGERPAGRSLDRTNNDEGYSPENCRWATGSEQNLNRRPATPKRECKYGHEFTPENTRINRNGTRACRACDRRRAVEYKARKKVLG